MEVKALSTPNWHFIVSSMQQSAKQGDRQSPTGFIRLTSGNQTWLAGKSPINRALKDKIIQIINGEIFVATLDYQNVMQSWKNLLRRDATS